MLELTGSDFSHSC